MAILLQSQAALAQQHIQFLDRSDKRNAEWDRRNTEMERRNAEMERGHAEMERKHAEIMKELDVIKAVLARHERILERLPDAIRQKIGFKNE
jgi:hypothetical protein